MVSKEIASLRKTLMDEDKTKEFIHYETDKIISEAIAADNPQILRDYFGFDAEELALYQRQNLQGLEAYNNAILWPH